MGSFLMTSSALVIVVSCLIAVGCSLPEPTTKEQDVTTVLSTDAGSNILDQIIGLRSVPDNASEATNQQKESDDKKNQEQQSIYEIAAKLNVQKFLELSKKAHLQPLLAGKGPYTLFAPTDEAIANLTVFEKLSKNAAAIEEFIINHIVSGNYTSQSLPHRISMLRLKSIGRIDIKFKREKGQFYVNGIEVEEKDILGVNGVIHTIRGVIYIPEATLAKDVDSPVTDQKVVTDKVVTVDWPTEGNISGKQGSSIPTLKPGGDYDGYGPSSINPNDYIPPEQGHVDAIHEMVKQWQKTLEREAQEAEKKQQEQSKAS